MKFHSFYLPNSAANSTNTILSAGNLLVAYAGHVEEHTSAQSDLRATQSVVYTLYSVLQLSLVFVKKYFTMLLL